MDSPRLEHRVQSEKEEKKPSVFVLSTNIPIRVDTVITDNCVSLSLFTYFISHFSHDDVMGKISLSKEAIGSQAKGNSGAGPWVCVYRAGHMTLPPEHRGQSRLIPMAEMN